MSRWVQAAPREVAVQVMSWRGGLQGETGAVWGQGGGHGGAERMPGSSSNAGRVCGRCRNGPAAGQGGVPRRVAQRCDGATAL